MTAPRDTEADQDDVQSQDATSPEPTDQQPAESAEQAQEAEQLAAQERSEQPEAAPRDPEPEAVPRAVPPRRDEPAEAGPGWASREQASPAARQEHTTVLPSGARRSAAAPARTAAPAARPTARPLATRSRRARLTLRRIDPWSVFLFSLVASVFIGLALVVAVAVMYAVLGSLGVTESLNELYAEVTGGDISTDALLTSGRIIGGAAVLAAVNVVFLTLLATLGALLYNLCSSFTGGIELTFGERD